MSDLPVFAIIGHPNEGKSSVVSTLAEDDAVAISPVPGETTRLGRFDLKADGRSIIEFVDTPGFQNPHKTLAWFVKHAGDGRNPASAFIEAHEGRQEFHHDCELMRPVAEGAGILYVVDGSRPITSADRAEMEILRLTGRPRMAIINQKSEEEDHIEEWRGAFLKSFNAIRIFNACAATFEERIGLLDALKSIDQDWSPQLEEAARLLREDWERRRRRVAEVIDDLLEQALTHSESKLVSRESDLERAQPALSEAYRKRLREMEERAWAEICRQFRHRRLKVELPEASVLQEDLFSEPTWQAFGLTGTQLAWAATAAGAGIGAGLDVMAGGTAFGLFTAAGAAISGGAALLKGRELAKMKIKRIPVGGFRIQIGPNRSEQFPFILTDRALGYARYVSRRAHARQDWTVKLAYSEGKAGASSRWTREERANALRYFEAIRKGDFESRERLWPMYRGLVVRELETAD